MYKLYRVYAYLLMRNNGLSGVNTVYGVVGFIRLLIWGGNSGEPKP